MARQVIEVGASANDGNGDTLRAAFIKTNEMFGELYSIQFSRLYTDLIGAPELFSGSYNDLTDVPQTSFNDLSDRPVFFDGEFSSLTNVPTTLAGYGITDAFDGSYNSLNDLPILFSGSYNDLTNTPDIPVLDQQLLTTSVPEFAGIQFADGVQYRAYLGQDFGKYVFTQITDVSVILGQGASGSWRPYTYEQGFVSSAASNPTLEHIPAPDSTGKFNGFYQSGVYEITAVFSAIGNNARSTMAVTIKAGDDGATANLGTIGTEFDVVNRSTATLSTIVRFTSPVLESNQIWFTASDTEVDAGAVSYISNVNVTIKKIV